MFLMQLNLVLRIGSGAKSVINIKDSPMPVMCSPGAPLRMSGPPSPYCPAVRVKWIYLRIRDWRGCSKII